MKKSLMISILMLLAGATQAQAQTTSGYYCQVDVAGTVSGYYEVYYRMTKTEWGSQRNYAVSVDRVNSNLMGVQAQVGVQPSQWNGKYITLGLINELSRRSSIGSLNMLIAGFVPLSIAMPTFDYDHLPFLSATVSGQLTSARCQRLGDDDYARRIYGR